MPRQQRQSPAFRFDRRSSGLLLHPTSLPGPFGSGDLGPEAHAFADFLAAAGQRWWQMLPVGPPGEGHSPYSAASAFAGHPALVSLQRLADEGLLDRRDLRTSRPRFSDARVEHQRVLAYRAALLRRAFERFRERGGPRGSDFARFVKENAFWLEDFALFAALKEATGNAPWAQWDDGVRRRRPAALARAAEELADEVAYQRFVQFAFDRQWQALRARCAAHGIGLIGDIPIFVAYDSAEVWANPHLFLLDAKLRPTVVSGCPPDAFCEEGQRWGHPHYDWKVHARDGYRWWVERFRQTLRWFDAVRIDHFLGFHRVWHVRASSPTAKGGRYVPGPGPAFFDALRAELGDVPIIAEDLGAVVPEALALRDRFNFPGMRILQFGFGGDAYHLPHSYPRRAVAYTGTHDNDTTAGWFRKLPAAERQRVLAYATDGRGAAAGADVVWPLIRAALASVADTAVFPVQDLLGLGSEARMNTPGTVKHNWAWRLPPGQLTPALAKRLRAACEVCGRA
jgi:4-alpha-glucanotransferase